MISKGDIWEESKQYGTFLDELCLIMIGFDGGQYVGWAGFLPMRLTNG